ncbi:unnamed protein product [Aspergillus oryzae]|nr:unnamed protein product [Aspergillus oryzae]
MSSPSPLEGVAPHIRNLLTTLHKQSTTQESAITDADFESQTFDDVMRDKFIALDEDKSQYLYQLCRIINAKTVVEAGTSFGVSTIYLALAVSANVAATGGTGRVIATENEPTKASKAREHWAQCGDAVSNVIDLREGDLRETLKRDIEAVDLLLLDSMSLLVFLSFAAQFTLLIAVGSLDSHGFAHVEANSAAYEIRGRCCGGQYHCRCGQV